MKRLALVSCLFAAGCGTSTPGTPSPKVLETVPADGATGVSLLPNIRITFDRSMDPLTVDTNVDDETCTGSVQLSGDDFTTCVRMEDQPLADGDAEVFSVRPAAPLAMLQEYKLRVRSTVQDAEGRRPRADFEMTTGFTTRQGPTVTSVTPADGATAVAGSSITITFSAAMDPSTITSNLGNSFCTGTVQVSSDEFSTCVRMQSNPTSPDATTFTAVAAAPLGSVTTYKVRVTAGAEDASGNPLAYEYESATGFLTRYRHTVVIDGVNDFSAATERFASTSAGYFGYLAWDDDWLYVGMEGPDVSSGNANIWLHVYVVGSGGTGTTTGQIYNTQQPTLPFPARWHFRWRANNGAETSIQTWDGADWVESGLSVVGDVFQQGEFVEARLSRSELSLGAGAKVHLNMINETGLAESTYAGVPSGSFVDGYDANHDYTKYYELDLAGSVLPNAHAPKP